MRACAARACAGVCVGGGACVHVHVATVYAPMAMSMEHSIVVHN